MARRFDYRRVKLHHSYTISELSALIGAHKHTISRWIAVGLKTTDAKRPLLVHGADFRAFMRARAPSKHRCQPGEFYCFGCRAPKRPALDMADYHPRTALRGLLSGICPVCGRMIYWSAPRKLGRSELEFSAVFSRGWEERKTMKTSQFSDAQKAFILRQGADGVPVADICRKAGISQATYFNWKKKYEGLQPPEMRRLKQLEDENAKLKKIVADLSLDREMLQDVIRRKL
jgi:putative transposase